ncbi:DNA helicase [Trifolium repens]|nr:DNA helicase [Trifolium repens]
MTYNEIETLLAIESLRAPLVSSPITNQERMLNEMRIKYRSYFVDYNVTIGAVVMPKLFTDDFGSEICRIANLMDSRENQFECLVEKVNDSIYLTRGWAALRDFYDIRIGAWLTLLYKGSGKIFLGMHDRFQKIMHPPIFVPPMKFVIDLTNVPSYFVNNLPQSLESHTYSHDDDAFDLAIEKSLTFYDISTGFLMLPYDGFGEIIFEEDVTSIKLVDECGNLWDCALVYVTFPFKHFKIGGQWSRLVAARRLIVGQTIRVGANPAEQTHTINLILDL